MDDHTSESVEIVNGYAPRDFGNALLRLQSTLHDKKIIKVLMVYSYYESNDCRLECCSSYASFRCEFVVRLNDGRHGYIDYDWIRDEMHSTSGAKIRFSDTIEGLQISEQVYNSGDWNPAALNDWIEAGFPKLDLTHSP